MKYRAEIDGLRAVAVLPVILFHAGFALFSGGFVGVDIFFVISGYLITTIICEDMQNKRFSLIGFYERRARRILPALFLVMFCCLPFAWVLMFPSQMKDFSQSLVAVSLFTSNILFWSKSGYFAPATEEAPLLHTWSLAVEEQYYIFFPIFLLFTLSSGQSRTFWLIVFLSALSIALSEWGWRHQETANFYLVPTRAWELFAGSLASFIVQKQGVKNSNFLSLFAIAAMLFAIFFFDKTTPFPSLYSLLPVLGVVGLILYGGEKTYIAKLLSTRLFVGIGLISYSAYLWHQPLFAFTRIYLNTKPSDALMLALSIASLVLAALSWKYIEGYFRVRTSSNIGRKEIFVFAGVGLTVFVSIGMLGHLSNGFERSRFTRGEIDVLSQRKNKSKQSQIIGDSATTPTWALLGDSHANSLQEAIGNMLKRRGESAITQTIDGCPPALHLWRHDRRTGYRCHNNYEAALKLVEENKIESVIVAARFALYLNSTRFDNRQGGIEVGSTDQVIYDHFDFRNTLRTQNIRSNEIARELKSYFKKLAKLDVQVYVLSGIPEVGWDTPKEAYRNIGHGETTTLREVYKARNSSAMKLFASFSSNPNITIINIENAMCDIMYCYATKDGIPLYYDTNHLNRTGANRAIEYFEKVVFGE